MSHFYFFNPCLRWTLSIIHGIWFVLEGGGVHEDPLWLLDYIYLEYFDTNELLLLLPAQQKVSWSATCQLADRPAEQEIETRRKTTLFTTISCLYVQKKLTSEQSWYKLISLSWWSASKYNITWIRGSVSKNGSGSGSSQKGPDPWIRIHSTAPIKIIYLPQVTLKVWAKSDLVECLPNLGSPFFLA